MVKINSIKIKLNSPMRGFVKGQCVNVITDNNGVILDSYWRKRLKESETSSTPFVEIVTKDKLDNKIEKKDKKSLNERGDL